jgi:ubiquinone/menaquinone biosynthesis C-methylase UbiE
MSQNSKEEELKSIASQLSCPAGENGLKTAENMALNNQGMILSAIGALSLNQEDVVLEIGPGNGSHLKALMEEAEDLQYHGVDISELMVMEASHRNKSLLEAGRATFVLSDGEQLSYPDATFNKAFTVNTLYFWKDPKAYAREIARVLKPGGVFCLCFAPKEFMVKLPFTNYIFQLYTLEEAERLLVGAGFELIDSVIHTEVVRIGAEQTIEREFITVIAHTAAGISG